MGLLIKARYVLSAALICLGAFGLTVLISTALFCWLVIFFWKLMGDE